MKMDQWWIIVGKALHIHSTISIRDEKPLPPLEVFITYGLIENKTRSPYLQPVLNKSGKIYN